MSRLGLSTFMLLGSLATLASACDVPHEGEPKSVQQRRVPNPEPKSRPLDQPSVDWPTMALAKVDDEIDGVRFSLSLPSGWLGRKALPRADTAPPSVTWRGANPSMDPSITVQIDDSPPATLAVAASEPLFHSQPTEVTRQEELEGGGFLISFVESDKDFASVVVWRTSAATHKVVRVNVHVRNTGGIANLDALRPWMQTVASSLVVQ